MHGIQMDVIDLGARRSLWGRRGRAERGGSRGSFWIGNMIDRVLFFGV
jgi:hypothetical protein